MGIIKIPSMAQNRQKQPVSFKKSLSRTIKSIKRDKYYLAMFIIPFVFIIIFRYLPIIGNIIAFRRYRVGASLLGTTWVGLKYFEMFLADPMFWTTFQNSIILSLLCLVINFPIPIIFALLLNEISSNTFKRISQTISYLPRFIATVVVVGMLKEILSPTNGIINELIGLFGVKPIYFLNEPSWYRFVYVLSDTWQYTGWNAIIYLGALSNINVELYEAASIDGAGRFRKINHVTLPGIMPTIIIILLLVIGNLLSRGYDKSILLYTPSNAQTSDIIETFVYRMGLVQNSYSYSAAVGLFSSIIGVTMLTSANALSRKFTDTSLF